jgi:Flp pilus assembly protein TadD
LPVEEGVPRAREAAERALSLQPDLIEGLVALGWIQALFDWDWKGAEKSLGRALELAPDDAEVLTTSGILAVNLGRCEEAIALGRRAIDRDPLNVQGHGLLGRAANRAGQLELAEEAFRKELELSPQGVSTRMRLAVTLVMQGRTKEALVEADNEPADWARACGRSIVLHALDRPSESDEALRELIDVGAEDAAYQIALVHGFRGEADACFEWLERAYAQRDSGLSLMKTEPFFRPLHEDARWDRLLRKMDLQD